MQALLVDSLIAYLLTPWVTNRFAGTMVRFADPQSPSFWKAINSGVVATLSVMFGLVFGAGAGGALAGMLGFSDTASWFSTLIGGTVALLLNLWRILLVYNRRRGTLPD